MRDLVPALLRGHGLKTREQLERKLERLLKEHPRAVGFVKVQIRSGKSAPDLQWSSMSRREASGALDGVTVLSSNIPAEEADGPALLRQWKAGGSIPLTRLLILVPPGPEPRGAGS